MSYFLAEENLTAGKLLTITGEEARHISLSRRKKIGNIIHVSGTDGNRFACRIQAIGKNTITLLPETKIQVPEEPLLKITLFQSLIAEQALDILLQKATETGVTKIVLFPAHNSPTKFAVAQKKLPRWSKIIIEAAKQCDRGVFPEIIITENLGEALFQARPLSLNILLNKDGAKLSSLKGNTHHTICLLVGPEGGFTDSELAEAKGSLNLELIALGPRTLRAETAAISGIGLLQNLWGDM